MTDRALKQAHSQAQDLLDFIDASPSPWHAVDTAVQRLSKQGYSALDESQAWQLKAGLGYYVVRGGASIIAFHMGQKNPMKPAFAWLARTPIRQAYASNPKRLTPLTI